MSNQEILNKYLLYLESSLKDNKIELDFFRDNLMLYTAMFFVNFRINNFIETGILINE